SVGARGDARPTVPAVARRRPGAARRRGGRPPLRGRGSLLRGLRRVVRGQRQASADHVRPAPYASGLRRPRRPSASGGHRPPTASAERDDRLARDLLERRPVRVAVDDETPALALAGDAALRRALLTAAQQAAGGALELELLLDGAARDRGGEHRGAQLGLLDQRDQL